VTRNIRLTIEFDGSRYAGWQFQPSRPTVQGEIEKVVRGIVGADVTVYGCGRTDAGVSARRYVANFHAAGHDRIVGQFGSCPKAAERLRAALNHFLPENIHVVSVEEAPAEFHARFSARRKTYVYRVVRAPSPLRRSHAWEYRYPLDVERLRKAAVLFEGRKDYQPFCQTRDTNGICTVEAVLVEAAGDEVTVTVRGDRFLYKMVRRIVGALLACGSGRLTYKDIRAALAGKPHTVFQTAPAQGLLLDSVEY
jgi:tRNA pseudouridine38-40 synthase